MVRRESMVLMEIKCCEAVETVVRTLAFVSLTRPTDQNQLITDLQLSYASIFENLINNYNTTWHKELRFDLS